MKSCRLKGSPGMRVLVVCGSPEVARPDVLETAAAACDRIVAVDRGLDALLAAGLICDVFVGDADTVGPDGRVLVDGAPSFEVERFDPYKDQTDLALALASVSRRWPGSEIVATCACGGKPDLALSVLGQLSRYRDGAVSIVENGFEARILKAGESWHMRDAVGRRFSVVALAEGTVVSESGLEWELDRFDLPLLGDQGISNFVTSDEANVSCHAGCAISYLFREKSPLA